MLIPSNLMAIITFPGIIVKNAVLIFFGLRLRSIDSFKNLFLSIFLPFLINSIITGIGGIITFFYLSTLLIPNGILEGLFGFFLIWVFLSIGMHALPTTADAKTLWSLSKKAVKEGSIGALIGYPIAAFLWLISFLKIIWIDLLFSIIIFYLPHQLLFA